MVDYVKNSTLLCLCKFNVKKLSVDPLNPPASHAGTAKQTARRELFGESTGRVFQTLNT